MVRLRTPPKGLVGEDRGTAREEMGSMGREDRNDTVTVSEYVLPHAHADPVEILIICCDCNLWHTILCT